MKPGEAGRRIEREKVLGLADFGKGGVGRVARRVFLALAASLPGGIARQVGKRAFGNSKLRLRTQNNS
eukprot:6072104-Pleurochrysis_carterae.AAC.1